MRTGRPVTSRWRLLARRQIEDSIEEARGMGLDPVATLAHIDRRRWSRPPSWPYQMWLKERSLAMQRLGLHPAPPPRVEYACRYCRDAGCLVCTPDPRGVDPCGGP